MSEFTKTELIATICAHTSETDERRKAQQGGGGRKIQKKTGACVRTKTRQKKRERESFAARAHALALVANGLFKKREREIWKKRREKKERCA